MSSLWHAYLASFVLSLPHTNALIRRLQDDAELRLLCGLNSPLPHRTTFNRFIKRLADHRDLVEECLADLTDRLAETLPDFGKKVAIDSTVVRTHSNPNRKHVSDPEASWTKKHSADSKDGEDEWYFGYKYHAVVDAVYGLPITGFTTTASRSDSPELPRLVSPNPPIHTGGRREDSGRVWRGSVVMVSSIRDLCPGRPCSRPLRSRSPEGHVGACAVVIDRGFNIGVWFMHRWLEAECQSPSARRSSQWLPCLLFSQSWGSPVRGPELHAL